jgi:hypothetical protein
MHVDYIYVRTPNQIHFQTDIKGGYRSLFTHWYTFFLFDDYATDLHMKRIVRDYIHYDNIVFCVAEKIIERLNKEALQLQREPQQSQLQLHQQQQQQQQQPSWSSIHIRHGELQYTNVQISPLELLEETKGWLNRSGIMYAYVRGVYDGSSHFI